MLSVSADIEITSGEPFRVPVEITNKDTGERYRSRLAVTSQGEIYIPVEVQALIGKAKEVRIEFI